MSLSVRFLFVLFIVFVGVSALLWLGIRPAYEEAILDDRRSFIVEYQQQKIRDAETLIHSWAASVQEFENRVFDGPEVSEITFSNIAAVTRELLVVRVVEKESGEFAEFRRSGYRDENPEMNQPTVSRLRTLDATRLSWDVSTERFLIERELNAGGAEFAVLALFDAYDLHQLLLSDNLGVGAEQVLWFPDGAWLSELDNVPERISYESLTRIGFTETNDGRRLLVASPFGLIQGMYTFYVDPERIMGPSRQIFIQGLWVSGAAFLLIGFVAWGLFSQLKKPVDQFISDVEPFADNKFDQPFTPLSLPELSAVSSKMEFIREKLLHYQQINAEKIIKEQQQNELLMYHASDMIANFDSAGAFTFTNVRLKELLEKLAEDQPVLNLDQLMGYRNLSYSVKKEDKTRRRHLEIYRESGELNVILPGEAERFFNLHKVEIRDRDNKLISGQLLLHDISQERKVDRMRTEMINIIMHELRNPLTGIRGVSEMLLNDEVSKEEAEEFYKVMFEGSNQMFDLINRFLKVAKLEADSARIEMEKFSLPDLLKNICQTMKPGLTKENLAFNLEIDENIPESYASRELMGDVIRNLLSNAIKYGPENRTIDISLSLDSSDAQNPMAAIKVTDYGYGISREYQEEIFRKFYRIKDHRQKQGTGLGLPYVREILLKHGGSISVESNEKIGSRFTAKIPLKAKQEPAV